MHQKIEGTDLPPREQLEREWRAFQSVEAGGTGAHVSFWEAARPVVVLGRSGRAYDHIIEDACRTDDVDVMRRQSGGGSVVLAPGCLNYAVVVAVVSRPELAAVAGSFAFILGRLVELIDLPGLAVAGTDLAFDGRKVSGNAQRRGRRALLHHGTLLYGFESALADRYLKEPARQPSYRARRRHSEFMGNLPLAGAMVRSRVEAGLETLLVPSRLRQGRPYA